MAQKSGCLKWFLGCLGVVLVVTFLTGIIVYVKRDAIMESDFMVRVKEGYDTAKNTMKDVMALGGKLEDELGVSANIVINQSGVTTNLQLNFENVAIFEGLDKDAQELKAKEIATFAAKNFDSIEIVEVISVSIKFTQGNAITFTQSNSWSWNLEELGVVLERSKASEE